MKRHHDLAPLAAAVGAILVGSMAAIPAANAEENPFGLAKLSKGYMVADKSMEGKRGGEKAKAEEGKCGSEKAKTKEGKCGGEKDKAKEGKCGEGKCGDLPDLRM